MPHESFEPQEFGFVLNVYYTVIEDEQQLMLPVFNSTVRVVESIEEWTSEDL
jgi:hypothetical protein